MTHDIVQFICYIIVHFVSHIIQYNQHIQERIHINTANQHIQERIHINTARDLMTNL
jgi:hypothetical protein